VDLFVINYLSFIFLAIYLPANFPSVKIIEKYGTRISLIIGVSLIMIGSWLRVLININFTPLIIG
jgi:hypothetical protein